MKEVFKKLICRVGWVICLLSFPQYGFSQSHVTLSLKNCSFSSDTTLEFDIYIVNDGATKLQLGALSMGINYDSVILNGGVPQASAFKFQTGTQDKIFGSSIRFSTQHAFTRHHLRLTMSPLSKQNAPVLIANKQFKIGRFTFTNTTKWTSKSTPSFMMQQINKGGLTTCSTNVIVNDDVASTTLDKEDNRAGVVDCQIIFK